MPNQPEQPKNFLWRDDALRDKQNALPNRPKQPNDGTDYLRPKPVVASVPIEQIAKMGTTGSAEQPKSEVLGGE